ncbi:MAG: CPBP family intramembrane glutamic endopeptidase [Polyangiales bacterium]|jgi:membrane protease YdiL (CAAX protease family)
MSQRGPIAVFIATSVTLAAYLFPYFYLPASWWRGIPSTFVILLTGALFFGRAMPRVYGLVMTWKQLAISIGLFAILLGLFSYVIFTWVVVEPLSVERYSYPPAQVHQLFQVFDDEILLRAALLTVLLKAFPHPRAVILVPAVLFAVGHHIVYRTGAVDIDWPAMVSIFAFAGIANTLFVRYRHIGYGFALHYAWNFYRFNSRYYLDGMPLSEGASFNYIEGNGWVALGSLLTFLAVFAWGANIADGALTHAPLQS